MVGIDEVGRGSWAGPLLVVACRQVNELPKGLDDSKRLSKNQRQALISQIEASCQLGEGWVKADEIDKLGLTRATRLGVKRALQSLKANNDETIIIDGHINYCSKKYLNASAQVKADQKVPIVSAASIYAKVKRDAYMSKMAKQYPLYLFEKHVGYGTLTHRAMLQQHGVCQLHRISFKPVAELVVLS